MNSTRPDAHLVQRPVQHDLASGIGWQYISAISHSTNSSTTSTPRDPFLVVLGMHRSGTSALTGALGALGFNTPHPGDRMDWPESNSEHWESVSLTTYNDHLLTKLGGSWEAPPDLPLKWEGDGALSELGSPLPILDAAYPEPGPRVWKDPRLCLLLPFWKTFLPSPIAAVLVWRSPLAVARSLQKRDGMHLADGVALWERYNRAALGNLDGLNTFVCSYEAVVRDPTTAMNTIADWLSALPQLSDMANHWHREQSADSIVQVDSAQEQDAGSELLLAQHHDLAHRLSLLEGGHLPLEVSSLASESDWTTALLAAWSGSRTREFQIELQNKQLELDRLRDSTSWRVTRPLRSMISILRSVRSKPTTLKGSRICPIVPHPSLPLQFLHIR